MYSTPLGTILAALPALTETERHRLLTDPSLTNLAAVFACVPDPRHRLGRRYALPFLLTCLVAALLCNCDSTRPWSNGAASNASCSCRSSDHCAFWRPLVRFIFALSPFATTSVG